MMKIIKFRCLVEHTRDAGKVVFKKNKVYEVEWWYGSNFHHILHRKRKNSKTFTRFNISSTFLSKRFMMEQVFIRDKRIDEIFTD